MKTQKLIPVLFAAGALSTGCLSTQNQGTLDAMHDSLNGKQLPFVEAYVEFAGPQARWAGPTTFTMHVVAKDANAAQISVAPALFNEPSAAPTMKKRAPAGETVQKGMSGEMAREQIAHLVTALQGTDTTFRGCLSPVRVRLIRADGALVEKQGCRGQRGWSNTASQSVDRFLTAALYGLEKAPASTAPATVSANTPAAAAAKTTSGTARTPAAAAVEVKKGK